MLPLSLFIFGIAAAVSFGLLFPDPNFPPVYLLFLPLLFIKIPAFFRCSLLIVMFLTGNLAIQPYLKPETTLKTLIKSRESQIFTIEGVIISRPQGDENGRKLIIRVDEISIEENGQKIPCKEIVSIKVGGIMSRQFFSGDIIRSDVKLKIPRNFGTTGEFNTERYYALKKIAATGFIKSDSEIEISGRDGSSSFSRYFDKTAAAIGDFIKEKEPGIEGGVLRALLIGDCSALPQSLKDAYSRTGVNHILSISGFHVGIIALALYQIWSAVFRLFPAILLYINLKRASCLMSIPAITYYLFLSGAAPATARSVIMLLFVAVTILIERETEQLNSIAIAAFLLLILNPAFLYDISFQLSFIAIWGLTVITPLIAGYQILNTDSLTAKLALFAAASTAAVVVTLLPVAYYFQQISITGILSNFLIVPLLGYGAVVAGGLSITCILFAPSAAGLMLGVAAFLTSVSNRLIEYLDQIPLLPLFVPTQADIVILLITLMVISALNTRKSKLTFFAFSPLLIATLHLFPADTASTALKIDFLSVGQGESTLVTLPGRHTILIDGGGSLTDTSWDLGRQLLLPALRKSGVRRIDIVVLTHSHPDHLKGLFAVIENLEIGEFWESGYNVGKEYEHLVKLLEQRHVRRRIISSQTPLAEISGLRIKCLFPFADKDMKFWPDDQNELSLVLKMEYGATSLIFTGDIGITTELALVSKKSDLRSTILKVPHHGSGYSTTPEFLKAVAPKLAVISAGYGNSFGLPAVETVARLKHFGVNTYRTDLDGTVTIIIPGQSKLPQITALRRQIN